jgi:hypothetical protein
MSTGKTMNLDDRLITERNIWLATTRPNGKPHLVPIWFVWSAARAYICTPADSVKARNLAANPRASFALEDGNRPHIIECHTRTLARPYPAEIVQAFLEKYGWNIQSDSSYNALIELTPEKWLSWSTG